MTTLKTERKKIRKKKEARKEGERERGKTMRWRDGKVFP